MYLGPRARKQIVFAADVFVSLRPFALCTLHPAISLALYDFVSFQPGIDGPGVMPPKSKRPKAKNDGPNRRKRGRRPADRDSGAKYADFHYSMSQCKPAVPGVGEALTAVDVLDFTSADCASLASRLEGNCALAAAHVTDAVTSLSQDVAQCVPVFVASARAHCDAVDKRLAMKAEALRDTIELLKAYVQQSFTAEQSFELLDDSAKGVKVLLEHTDELPDMSSVLTSAGTNTAGVRLTECTRVTAPSKPALAPGSNPPWFNRGQTTTMTSVFRDPDGEPLLGVLLDDLVCSFEDEDEGWEVRPLSIEAGVLSVEVSLSADCSNFATLTFLLVPFAVAQYAQLKVRPVTEIISLLKITACAKQCAMFS